MDVRFSRQFKEAFIRERILQEHCGAKRILDALA